jgi:hypothetical protein
MLGLSNTIDRISSFFYETETSSRDVALVKLREEWSRLSLRNILVHTWPEVRRAVRGSRRKEVESVLPKSEFGDDLLRD